MARRGRPTKYKPEYAEQAYQYCLLGYTVAELATAFGVDPDTVCVWQKKYPDFSESIKKGRLPADAKVAQALYRRALGYKHKAVKVFAFEGQTIEHEYVEHYPPDFHSIRFWLMNRQPKKWRDKQGSDEANTDRLDELFEALRNSPGGGNNSGNGGN